MIVIVDLTGADRSEMELVSPGAIALLHELVLGILGF